MKKFLLKYFYPGQGLEIDFNLNFYFGLFESGSKYLPGLVVWRWKNDSNHRDSFGLDIRIFGHAWIYQDNHWEKRL